MKNIFRINYSQNGISKEEFYPCLTYIDEQGNALGVLFDSFVFDLSAVGNNMSEWENAIDAIFEQDRDLRALNMSFADVGLMLGLNKKCEIYIQAPIPAVSLLPFGDINRDGITEKLLDTDDCIRAYEWFVTAVKRRFSAHDLSRLDFKGFVIDDNASEDFKNGFFAVNSNNSVGGIVYPRNDISVDSYDISSRINDDFKGGLRIFSSNENNYLSKCAVSSDGYERIIYRSLYESLYGIGIESEPQTEEPLVEITEEAPKEINASFNDECDTLEHQDFSPVLDGTAHDRIFVDVPEDTAEMIPEKTKLARTKPISQEKKRLLVGAGVAAAVLGIAYIIKKASED